MKFHPNDPALFRELARQGHRVEVIGGTCLASTFATDAATGAVVLHPETSAIAPYLDSLDCFLYRVNPNWYETGGTSVEEAMAMGLPVILFESNIGIAELVDHGRNGYAVETEAQALACIKELQASPRLRHEIGTAARATMISAMQSQRQAILEQYAAELPDEVL